jgi:hypothetical protein
MTSPSAETPRASDVLRVFGPDKRPKLELVCLRTGERYPVDSPRSLWRVLSGPQTDLR